MKLKKSFYKAYVYANIKMLHKRLRQCY